MKAISKEQIDELDTWWDDYQECEMVRLDHLQALYDNAPSVDSEPVAYTWKVDLGRYKTDGFGKENPWANDSIEHQAKFEIKPLYTTPQPDRVAELEAKLKEYEADAKRWSKFVYLAERGNLPDSVMEGYSKKEITHDIDQAMKG